MQLTWYHLKNCSLLFCVSFPPQLLHPLLFLPVSISVSVSLSMCMCVYVCVSVCVCVCVCVCVHALISACAEIRKELSEISSFLLPSRFLESNSGHWKSWWSGPRYLLSKLISPHGIIYFFILWNSTQMSSYQNYCNISSPWRKRSTFSSVKFLQWTGPYAYY